MTKPTMAAYLNEVRAEMEKQKITSSAYEFLELATTFHAIIEANYYSDFEALACCEQILGIMADEITRISADVSA